MMNTIVNEKTITFKELEQKVFKDICEIGQTLTKDFLEQYDAMLSKERDRSIYRHKGYRKTVIKTVYGEVEYKRAIYEVKGEDDLKKYVYLLDEALELNQIGYISENMAELMVKCITEMSYRESAAKVSEMTGQSISAMGIWNVIQTLGNKVCEEEERLVEEHSQGHIQGEYITPILFEEADGVYVNLQGKDRKESRQRKAELKVAIAYDGWRQEGKGRYRLNEKVAIAGFAKSKEFQACREAVIANKFNLDEVETRILNGDGGGWIKKVKDKETIFQLDPFHKYKAVKEYIQDYRAQKAVCEYLKDGEIEVLFEYLEIYRDSLSDDKEIEDVEKLIRYYRNNEKGLLPYQKQIERLPKAVEGIEYRNLGTMENHIWSIIARRMKHNHSSWSRRGGNHLAKILAKKCSGKLCEVTEKLKVFREEEIKEIYEPILLSAKVAKKVGKGYEYPVQGHMVALERGSIGSRHSLNVITGYA